MKKRIVALLLVTMMILSLAACGEKSVNKADATGSSISVCLSAEPNTIDPALNSAVVGSTLAAHLFSGLAKWEEKMVDFLLWLIQ